VVVVAVGAVAAVCVRAGVVYAGRRYLRWCSAARRGDIARTLPVDRVQNIKKENLSMNPGRPSRMIHRDSTGEVG